MSYPTLFTTPGMRTFAEAVDAERQQQLAKWGDQRHPDLDSRDIDIVTRHEYQFRATRWQEINAERAECTSSWRCSDTTAHAHTAWDGVLLEEVYEALAEADPARLRAELVQIAAVCQAWVHDLDRRSTEAEQETNAELRLAIPPRGSRRPVRDVGGGL